MYPYCQSESLLLQFVLDTFFEMQKAVENQDSLEKMEKLLLKMQHFCTFSPKLACAIPLLQKARIATLNLAIQKKKDFKKLSSFLAQTLKIFLKASKAHLKKETFLLFLVERQLLSLFTLPFSSDEELKRYIVSKYAKRGFRM